MKILYLLSLLLFFNNTFSQNYSMENNLFFLSNDAMQGRLVGSESEKKCANYIAQIFESYHLKPIDTNFFQEFETVYNSNPHDSLKGNPIQIKSQNVVGFLDNNSDKTIVIGAHYDHIGKNEYHQSLAPQLQNQIHNGADDNASGVAGLLELAKRFTTNDEKENFNFIFVCFSGEEIGLIGSKAFVENITSVRKIDMMINMDMIGRVDSENHLYIGGVGTSPLFLDYFAKNKSEYFNIVTDNSGIGPSDHTSFYLKDIPVLFFFTGSHSDYHKPSDDYEKINLVGLRETVNFIETLTLKLSVESKIPFTKTKTKSEGRSTSFKVTLGILPNYSNSETGLLIDNVTENKPADKAHLKQGDIIIGINKCKVTDIYSYMDCLSKLKHGETIKIFFLRDNKKYKVKTIV